jgi:ribonuclease J
MAMEASTGTIVSGPDIVSRGFVYVRGAEDLMDSAHAVVSDTIAQLEDHGIRDWSKIKTEVKSTLSDFVWKETQRRPMILPIIQEV